MTTVPVVRLKTTLTATTFWVGASKLPLAVADCTAVPLAKGVIDRFLPSKFTPSLEKKKETVPVQVPVMPTPTFEVPPVYRTSDIWSAFSASRITVAMAVYLHSIMKTLDQSMYCGYCVGVASLRAGCTRALTMS